ncbi:BlaI/MecI/CopY family transcriptional regulator [Nonomuraea jabiensis]|uniref:BlaI/MecI/CopY family transcriptional regulator n=1 Tax=Nonomuraea jabiensis TaxID=882448 RepID=UPI003D763F2D
MANLGSLERAIMDVLWDAGKPMRVRELLVRLNEERELAYTTKDERVSDLMLEALSASADRLPVLARFAQSVEEEDALALMEELSRRQRRSTT